MDLEWLYILKDFTIQIHLVWRMLSLGGAIYLLLYVHPLWNLPDPGEADTARNLPNSVNWTISQNDSVTGTLSSGWGWKQFTSRFSIPSQPTQPVHEIKVIIFNQRLTHACSSLRCGQWFHHFSCPNIFFAFCFTISDFEDNTLNS